MNQGTWEDTHERVLWTWDEPRNESEVKLEWRVPWWRWFCIYPCVADSFENQGHELLNEDLEDDIKGDI